MNITRQELIEKHCVRREDGLEFPLFTYDSYDVKTDTYINLVITKTVSKLEEDRKKQIDICPEPTAEERIAQLEQDKEALAQNVYALAEVLEALIGGEEDGQEESATENTEG